MLKRTITGFIILIVLAGFIALRLVSQLFFDALILAIICGAVFEVSKVIKAQNQTFYVPLVMALGVFSWAAFRYLYNPVLCIMLCLILVFLVSFIFEIVSINKIKDEGEVNSQKLNEKTNNTMFVAIYPVVLISSFFGLNYLGVNLGFVAIILTFMISMFTDVGAYCFGIAFGRNSKHKLAPAISPKKSVVGAVFGMIFGLIAGGLGWLFFYHLGWFGALGKLTLSKSIIIFALVGLFGSVATQLGDLYASAVKRKVGLKDFSNLLPGHGGIMDRLDGEMFCASLVFIVFALFI
ncbi:MAG: phosphatidate cytidylyltransferase [bacterium]|nr:phosphatidate cytidylyltransferase [bacterium]